MYRISFPYSPCMGGILYIDDLITKAPPPGKRYGKVLLGRVIQIARDNCISGRKTQGVKLFRLSPQERIVSVALFPGENLAVDEPL